MFGYRRKKRRTLSYGMFNLDDYGLAAKNARVLERIYHKGQRLAWDGKEVLDALIAEHGPPTMPEETKRALGRIFSVIMWGELAAWRISAELADEIEPLEPKMAATSQAHDEARHFYVLHDYLEALGALPDSIDPGARRVLEGVLNADTLAKKLLGMQLMIEPMALTLFHIIKQLDVEPVLTHLLPYYERDEARHVALGVQYLPALLDGASKRETLSMLAYCSATITSRADDNYISASQSAVGLGSRTPMEGVDGGALGHDGRAGEEADGRVREVREDWCGCGAGGDAPRYGCEVSGGAEAAFGAEDSASLEDAA